MKRFPVFLLMILFAAFKCRAQQLKYTAFTVNDGLPSNNVYRCIEDDKGFLWVATDAGIARFDGKHFQVFTGQQGLPDNEVLAVIKELNGRIWVNCFKQSPAYFDEVKNRFINAGEDSILAKIKEDTGVMYAFPQLGGGIMFVNSKGSFIIKNNKLIAYPIGKKTDGFFIKENDDGSLLKYGTAPQKAGSTIIQSKIYLQKGGAYSDSVIIRTNRPGDLFLMGHNDGKLFQLNYTKAICYIYSNFSTRPIRFTVDSVITPEPFDNFEFTPNCFYLLGISGKIYLYNKKTLQQEAVVGGNYLPNSMYKDSKGNIWVSTIDKGLLFYRKNQFGVIGAPANITSTNFLSIARRADGTLLAGNFYGEVMETKQSKAKVHTIPKKNLIARQRKILLSQNKVFTFSEVGTYIDFSRAVLGKLLACKTAINYSDSIIIIGQSMALQKLNTLTETASRLTMSRKRVTALTHDANGMIYFGSTDGLYRYDYVSQRVTALNAETPLLRERITSLCTTSDDLLWLATSGSGVGVVKGGHLLAHISEKEGLINNAARSITAGKPGQVWVGTSGGISVVNYAMKQGRLRFTVQNLSANDGLTNNVVNEMLYQSDTVFAATANGISAIPANIAIPRFNIPVQLIRMSINQQDTTLSAAYKLAYNQKNILMQFAGIELSGHFKNLRYTLDNNAAWINLDENTLSLQLSSGYHTVQVRAVDVNGNISNKILQIRFDVATPFWKALWFWLLLGMLAQLLVIYLVNRRQKRRKGARLAKEIASVQTAALEQQAFTSLMNPHFMFNALNSIQHYINVQDRQNANRYLSDFASLIRKNFEAAQQSFIPLEQEIENIKIYLRLEQMRFKERFSYQILVNDNLDTEDWMIPTMILQPLLENALLHGIIPSSIDGELIINFEEQQGDLLIKITDNGIGIANSMALKQAGNHKSRGMELIKKRIVALSRFGNHGITITMQPAFESEKNPGNQIILFIPNELYQAWHKSQHA